MRIKKVALAAIPLAAVGIYFLISRYSSIKAVQSVFSEKIPRLHLPAAAGPALKIKYKDGLTGEKKKKVKREETVYQFVLQRKDENDFVKIAKQFNLQGQPKRLDTATEQQLFLKDGERQLVLDINAGTWSYSDFSKLFNSASASKQPISDAEVERIAASYLQDRNWLPSDFKFAGVSAVTQQSESQASPDVLNKTVFFYRHLDGKPVYGVSRIIVDVSNDGNVIGVSRFFKEIKPSKVKPLKSLDKALQEVQAQEGMVTTDDTSIVEADIVDADTIYYEDSGSITEQPYLQPVFRFKMKGNSAQKNKVVEFEHILTAVSDDQLLPEEKKKPEKIESCGPDLPKKCTPGS
jgi:hypothetical protein